MILIQTNSVKMLANPLTFTYENLSTMKFKELQKLSVQFHVNKRWAKKQDLIEKLLALKGEEVFNNEKTSDIKQKEEKEWTDGSIAFGGLGVIEEKENDLNKRLTFNIDKPNLSSSDARLTFEISQTGNNLVSTHQENFNSRETYDIAPSKKDFDVENLVDSRATFDVPQNDDRLLKEIQKDEIENELSENKTFSLNKNRLTEKMDPRATFDVPQNGKMLIQETENELSKNLITSRKSAGKISKETQKKAKSRLSQNDIRQNFNSKENMDKKLTFGISIKSDKNVEVPQVKMLTIPYEKVPKRNKKDVQPLKSEKTPMKLSRKSINIKKTSRPLGGKVELLKSPIPTSIGKPVNGQILMQSLTRTQPKQIVQKKPSTKLQFDEEKKSSCMKSQNTDDSNKENLKRNLRRRKSKTEDNALAKKTNSVKVSFMSPPASLRNSSRVSLPLKKTPYKEDANGKITSARMNQTISRIPKAKANVATTRPGITKMPDFAKIHQKQFEQMDSLHDYIKKKEERARKLFGTPQPGPQAKFQSAINEKPKSDFGKLYENSRNITPAKKKETIAQKIAIKNRLPPPKIQTDVKDKNRSHIHGVRTNKRFELQMKFRKMM